MHSEEWAKGYYEGQQDERARRVSVNELPEFPVDDATLDLLWQAVRPGVEADRSSMGEFLDLMSRLGGSDPGAVEEETDDIRVMRDQHYHEHDVVAALVTEIRRLRSIAEGETQCEGCNAVIPEGKAHYDVEGVALCDGCWKDLTTSSRTTTGKDDS